MLQQTNLTADFFFNNFRKMQHFLVFILFLMVKWRRRNVQDDEIEQRQICCHNTCFTYSGAQHFFFCGPKINFLGPKKIFSRAQKITFLGFKNNSFGAQNCIFLGHNNHFSGVKWTTRTHNNLQYSNSYSAYSMKRITCNKIYHETLMFPFDAQNTDSIMHYSLSHISIYNKKQQSVYRETQ